MGHESFFYFECRSCYVKLIRTICVSYDSLHTFAAHILRWMKELLRLPFRKCDMRSTFWTHGGKMARTLRSGTNFKRLFLREIFEYAEDILRQWRALRPLPSKTLGGSFSAISKTHFCRKYKKIWKMKNDEECKWNTNVQRCSQG